MNQNTHILEIRNLISKDELELAFTHIQQLLANNKRLDAVLLQSARFQNIQNQIKLGLIHNQDAEIVLNQVRAGLLYLLRKIEESKEIKSVERSLEKTQKAEKIYNIDRIENAHFS